MIEEAREMLATDLSAPVRDLLERMIEALEEKDRELSYWTNRAN